MGTSLEPAPRLDRQAVVRGVVDEYELFAELISGLTEEQWTAPTRCGDATVADVAAHVAGIADDVITGRTADRTFEHHVADFAATDRVELAGRVRAHAAGIAAVLGSLDDTAWEADGPIAGMSIGAAVLLLWHENYLHTDDIRAGAGLPSVGGAGLRASLEYTIRQLEAKGWGPARLELTAMPVLAVGDGDGPVVRADPLAFLLAATGRADAGAVGPGGPVNIYV